MSFLDDALKTLMTGHNYFNRDEYGSTWHNGHKPEIVERGDDYLIVKAVSGSDAATVMEWTTPAHSSGHGASWVTTALPNGTYRIKAEIWDKLPK